MQRVNILFLKGILLCCVCLCSTGCLWPWHRKPVNFGPPAPKVLTVAPTLEEIMNAVNANSDRVHSVISQNAKIDILGVVGVPILSGTLAISQPDNFRLQAGTGLLGQEMDIGSNATHYWMWVRRSDPPAVFVGSHDRYATSSARQIMPIEPSWLSSAFGMVHFDKNAHHEGPILRPDSKLEIRSTFNTVNGPLTRVAVIDATRAWVLEQHVYDAQGTLLASAIALSHRYYPGEQVSLPQKVELRMPLAKLALTIDVGNATVNQMIGDPNLIWAVPHLEGYPIISLDGPAIQAVQPGQSNPPGQHAAPQNQPSNQNGSQGFSSVRPQATPPQQNAPIPAWQ